MQRAQSFFNELCALCYFNLCLNFPQTPINSSQQSIKIKVFTQSHAHHNQIQRWNNSHHLSVIATTEIHISRNIWEPSTGVESKVSAIFSVGCRRWCCYTILPLKILVCFLVKNSGKYWDKCLFYSSKFEAKMVLHILPNFHQIVVCHSSSLYVNTTSQILPNREL